MGAPVIGEGQARSRLEATDAREGEADLLGQRQHLRRGF